MEEEGLEDQCVVVAHKDGDPDVSKVEDGWAAVGAGSDE